MASKRGQCGGNHRRKSNTTPIQTIITSARKVNNQNILASRNAIRYGNLLNIHPDTSTNSTSFNTILKIKQSNNGTLVRPIPTVQGYGRYCYSTQLNPNIRHLILQNDYFSPFMLISPTSLDRSCHNNCLIKPMLIPAATRCTSKPIDFALLNTRSVCNKSSLVKDHVVDNDNDLLAMTETWLSDSDMDAYVIRDLCPTGYQLFNVPRGRRGGGVALLYKNLLKFKS